MAHLIVSFFVAFATAFGVYGETSSLLLAFIAYSCSGALVLLLVLAGTALFSREQETTQFDAASA